MKNRELIQIRDMRGPRQLHLIRGFSGTPVEYHNAGPWMIVASPHSGDLGRDVEEDWISACLEIDNFGPRVHWLIVDRCVFDQLRPGYVIAPLHRVGDPVGWV